MTNPWAIEHLAKDRMNQIRLDAPRRREASRHDTTLRERVGWSLISLGAHLALDQRALPRANHAG